jgi:hypothetical protein
MERNTYILHNEKYCCNNKSDACLLTIASSIIVLVLLLLVQKKLKEVFNFYVKLDGAITHKVSLLLFYFIILQC